MLAGMNRFAPAVLALAALSTSALAAPRQTLRPTANPGGVIAAEIGFAALAQEKGQWTAFRQTAAKGAKMFAPQPVLVVDYLKNRKDPPVAVKWQPHMVWSSCDGSIAVTRGAWQRPDSVGYFITVWQRQKDGGYKWVLDQGDALDKPLAEPDSIEGVVADCPAPGQRGDHKDDLRDAKGRPLTGPQAIADPLNATSNDRTLAWTTTVDAAGARDFTLRLRKDGAMRDVLHASVKPSAG
jgi:hypothetical protein